MTVGLDTSVVIRLLTGDPPEQAAKAEALEALQQLLESGDVGPVGFAREILKKTPNLALAKPGFVDRILHAEVRSHASQLITLEKAPAKLPATKVL